MGVLIDVSVEPEMSISEVVTRQWQEFTEKAGWYPGGKWLGWPYDVEASEDDRKITVFAGWRKAEETLIGANDIVEMVANKVHGFALAAQGETIGSIEGVVA